MTTENTKALEEKIANLEALVARGEKAVNEATPEEKKHRARKIGAAIGRGSLAPFKFLGKGTIWLSRQTWEGTKAAGRAMRDEYRRQGEEGYRDHQPE